MTQPLTYIFLQSCTYRLPFRGPTCLRVKVSFPILVCIYHWDKTPQPKADWGKGLFSLLISSSVHHEGPQGRNREAGTEAEAMVEGGSLELARLGF